ncbi:baculoviral IAP repeat containing 2 L homeolog isoform X1 [Xenopus laevis]|uniref:RING-type E3 ubiquitin transferase n=3 Tax=Xenopus laevis TaxID=8355 RepID=A0A1L8HJ69_XENLA|nr:baculoviral IAP repeat containing 2 L homeolog isoform X1 [Xenopus laevis]XP_018100609.1 baculoviral IAP repeat containing 2 L homeolog isoform X1 [Xenopus laevis]OCT96132.1 hypothetical protein XELAEV_18013815mg [Xenopus laevis]
MPPFLLPLFTHTMANEILDRNPDLAKWVKSNPSMCKITLDFSCELYRLSTFCTFPTNTQVSERNLAKAGFYYTGSDDKVKCFTCGLMLDNWKKGDNAFEKHKKLYPSCSFIQNVPPVNLGASLHSAFSPPASNSTPMSSAASENDKVEAISMKYCSIPQNPVTFRGIEDLSHIRTSEYMYTEEARLNSFKEWTNAFLTPPELAKAGFYFVGPGDKVACFTCDGKLSNWEPNDNAMSEHRRHFPDCPFVKTSTRVSSRFSVSNVSMQASSARLKTFVSWPPRIPVSPTQLAEAGFYYVGRNDDVKCFCCDGGLRCWESGDDPWVEHAKWFPRCEYLLNVRGQDFVREVQERHPHLLDQLLSSSENQNEAKNTPIIRLGTENSQEDEIMMSTPMVQTALEMGFNRRLVKRTIQSKILTSGENYIQLDDLISDLLSAQEEQTEEERNRQAEENSMDDISVIRKSRMALSQHIASRSIPILDYLLSSNDITTAEYEDIKVKTQPILQAQEMIETIITKGKTAVQTLKNCLQKHDPNLFRQLFTEQSLKCISLDDCSDLSMEEQLRRLQEERTCKICMDQEVSIVFIPCGHLVVCKDCAPSLRKCPICRGTIKGTVRTFLS